MNINPLVGKRNYGDLGSGSPPKQRSIGIRSDSGNRNLIESPRSMNDDPNDLVYPYKPPTERG